MKNYNYTNFNKSANPAWAKRWAEKLKGIKIPFKLTFVIIGILSTIWFLVRVIPKPSRAAYPCMKAVAPFMSSFIIWILSIGSSFILFKKSKALFGKAKYVKALSLLSLALVAFSVFVYQNSNTIFAKSNNVKSVRTINAPIGTAKGIMPGRVVWAHNPDATNEDCTNSMGVQSDLTDDDGFFLPQNTDQAQVDAMIDESIMDLAGATTISEAWDKIFKYFNKEHGAGEVGYTAGEKIFIKINQTSASWLTNDYNFEYKTQSWIKGNYGIVETSPQVTLSIVKHLVDVVGVNQEDIIIADPISKVYPHFYNHIYALYPNVLFGDRRDLTQIERTKLSVTSTDVIFYSDKGTVLINENNIKSLSDKMYEEMYYADYLINIAALKGHERGGITLTAKNHFGSHSRDGARHLHPGLVWVDAADIPGNSDQLRTNYGVYRVLVDIMGHEKLGKNTLVHIVDGLWGGPHDTKQPVKWLMAPFLNDWTSSIFMSLDQVALESVCFDFLSEEFDGTYTYPELGEKFNFPNYGAVEDYLMQAADPTAWPTGITYDPEGDGSVLTSLGVYEHWNDANNKQYTRNLATGDGIELTKLTDFTPIIINPTDVNSSESVFEVFPNPASDYVNVSLSSNFSDISVSIIDMKGAELYTVNNISGNTVTVPVSQLNKGNYILKIVSDKMTESQIITIQ